MMKQNVSRSWCVGVGVATVLLGVAGPAAADRKVFPGLMCVDRNDTTPDISYLANGSVFNHTAATTGINCAIVRDNTLSSMDVVDWDVVVDRNGSSVVWDIWLHSLDAQGNSGFATFVTVPGGTGGFVSLDGTSIVSAFANGQLWLATPLPPGAEIASYQIEESD